MVDVAKLIGVVKIFDAPMSFALPIFALSKKHERLMQDINEKGCIAGFAEIDISDLQLFPITSGVEKRIGESAIYVFEAEPEDFQVDEKSGLIPIVQRALGQAQLRNRPFARSDIAAFCGDMATAENADIQAARNLPDGVTKHYFRVDILARDKIKKVFAAHYDGKYLAPAFVINEGVHGVTVVLETGSSSDDLERMQVVINACCNDLARLLQRSDHIWTCNVVVSNEQVNETKYITDGDHSHRLRESTIRTDPPDPAVERSRRRHGHLPGHIRNAFLQAAEVFAATAPGERLPRVPFQIKYRDRTISIAEACGLVWGCTDIMPGSDFRALCDGLDEEMQPKRQTYAAAAHALLANLKAQGWVDAAADIRLKRLYDRRDAVIEKAVKLFAAENGLNLSDHLQRGRAENAVYRAIERWSEQELEDHPSVPATRFETLLLQICEHGEELGAEEDVCFFESHDDVEESEA